MREGKLLNLINFSLNITLKNFINFYFTGLRKKFSKVLKSRFEITENNLLSNYDLQDWSIFFNFIFTIVPPKKFYNKKKLLNIFYLDLINSYRGWRHLRGLPVRGQRTWSNAWSVYKSNLILRHYKISLLKKIYFESSTRDLNLVYAAEQFNMLWKLQWENEWKVAKKKRSSFLKKKQGLLKVNLLAIAHGQINESKNAQNKGKQKSKNANLFTMGFDPGFTKSLLRANLKTKLKKDPKKTK